MTVSSATNKVTYAGDGSTVNFSTSFTFAADTEVTVTLVLDSDESETAWTNGTEYTLTGAGTGNAGTLTVDTSPTDYTPASGTTLVIELLPAFTQPTPLPRGGTVSPKGTLEPMYDKLLRQVLRLKDQVDLSLKISKTETSVGAVPNATNRADKIFTFDSSGDPTATAAADLSLITVSSFMSTVLDDTTAAAARTTLGAGVGSMSNVVEDTTPQLGGFLDANGNYMQREKGTDIASATPTVPTDGDYFDVTGTTTIATWTVAADRSFAVQFDGALTLTHNATTQDLPGEADITTAAGDVAHYQSTGANTVQCTGYTKADGTAVVAAGGKVTPFTITHTSDTALATQAAGGTQMGTASSQTIPSAGVIRVTVLELELDETEGSAAAHVGLAIKVGTDALMWSQGDGPAGTSAYNFIGVVNTSVGSMLVETGSFNLNGQTYGAPSIWSFDIVGRGITAGAAKDVEVWLGDNIQAGTGEATVTGTTKTARFLVEIIDTT